MGNVSGLMAKVYSGSPVSRTSVFILSDGSFVVQWDETRVQELLTGRYRSYGDGDFGHVITDYELNQLKAAGRVEHFNRQYVWLYSLPEAGRYETDTKAPYYIRKRVRSYYLNTTLPKERLEEIQVLLDALELNHEFLVRARNDLISILGKNGAPFRSLQDAELAQKHLISKAPAIFQHTAIAFIETTDTTNHYTRQPEYNPDIADLKTIIASQTDISVTEGKRVVLVSSDTDEQTAIAGLLDAMKMRVWVAGQAAEGLQLLEDCDPHLLIMNLQLADMHGWELLAKIKEIESLQKLPKIILADHSTSPDAQSFALTVVKVDAYLIRPVSMAQLRQHVWMTLRDRLVMD